MIQAATRAFQARVRESIVTEQEKKQAEALIARLEISVGEIAPRDGAAAPLIADMIQSLNGLRSVLGLNKSVH